MLNSKFSGVTLGAERLQLGSETLHLKLRLQDGF